MRGGGQSRRYRGHCRLGICMHDRRVPFPGSKSVLSAGGYPVGPAMSTGWRLRPGTVVVEVAPSRSAGNAPSRSAGKPKRKAPSPCSRSVRRRTSGTDAVPQVAKVRTPKQDNEATRKRCVRPQDAVQVAVYESRWWSLPGAWCPVAGAHFPEPGCCWGCRPAGRCPVPGARCPVPGARRHAVAGDPCPSPGAWCSVPGAQCPVLGCG